MTERLVERACVAIPTYRRTEQLAMLLTALAAQELPVDCEVAVVVFDNDTSPSAQRTVVDLSPRFPSPLTYEHVPEPGLSSVRNAAIAYARRGFDMLAMIDDDERPRPRWLIELVHALRTSRSDAAIGPVPQIVPAHAPRWLRTGTFYDLPTFADGAMMNLGYSGNCLLRVASLERYGVMFDTDLNAAGGEDMLFFKDFLQRGARIVYAAKAIATEALPASRLTARYLIALSYRRGNTLAICDWRLDGSAPRMALRACKAAARVALGLLTIIPLGILRGRTGLMIASCNIAQGCGAATGLGGHIYHAYRRDDTVRA
jgi:glycosyltransferase involved in cell wall biosynthesis